jgi:hypothetical protein
MILLSRDQFREGVFARDKHKCVVCGAPAQDAHHILERRLWSDGGYYLNNGASVCGIHHIECEETTISVDQIREYAGILKPIIPEHFYDDVEYDKWGNVVLTNGTRLKGELFNDISVQKILQQGGVLPLFTHYVKYPRTYHLPWSENKSSDDRVMESLTHFVGKRVIVTEKMDGENTTMYNDYIHARSLDSRSNETRDWAKNFWSDISYNIPPEWRVCAENLYAKHSIHYVDLSTYVMGFSVWDDLNNCLDWDATQEWFELIGITSVPVLYDGIWDPMAIKQLWHERNWGNSEGYVVRLAESFHFKDFKQSVAKYVRRDHVRTTQHWMYGQPVVPNILRKD